MSNWSLFQTVGGFSSSSTSTAISMSGIGAGSLLVAAAMWSDPGGISTVHGGISDPSQGVWTPIDGQLNSVDGLVAVQLFYIRNAVAGSYTVTFTVTSTVNLVGFRIYEYRGSGLGTADGFGFGHLSASLTTGFANDLAVLYAQTGSLTPTQSNPGFVTETAPPANNGSIFADNSNVPVGTSALTITATSTSEDATLAAGFRSAFAITVLNSWGVAGIDSTGILTLPVSPANGNSLIVGVALPYAPPITLVSVQDNNLNNLVQDHVVTDSGNVYLYFYRLQNCSGVTSITVKESAATNGYYGLIALECSGVNPTTPVDAFGSFGVNNANPNSYSAVTATNGVTTDLVVALIFQNGNAGFFQPWTVTTFVDVPHGKYIAMSYQTVLGAGTYTPQASNTNGFYSYSLSGAYRVAPAPVGGAALTLAALTLGQGGIDLSGSLSLGLRRIKE